MADNRWRAFLDTNVLIAGLASRTGASAAILDLGEAEEILVVMSRHVLLEAHRVFEAKFPHLTGQFRLFIKNLTPLLIDDPKPQALSEAGRVIEPGDAPILAAVPGLPVAPARAGKGQQLDYLVTLDKKHFITPKVRNYVTTPIVTPAEFLMAFRRFWGKAG